MAEKPPCGVIMVRIKPCRATVRAETTRSEPDFDNETKPRVGTAGVDHVLANVRGYRVARLIEAVTLPVDERAELVAGNAAHQVGPAAIALKF
ncbi:MAG: hypothetical protein ACPGQM_03270 [Alphaproteobacteria bacterium]